MRQRVKVLKHSPLYETKPFLKWAGGKRSVLPELLARLPEKFGDYYEPFMGGAALFFGMEAKARAFLSDSNAELVNAYNMVKERPEEVINLLQAHEAAHSREYYYRMRETALSGPEGAARLIYLNRTCYNGLYRVNKAGKFNVPMGRYKNPGIARPDSIKAASRALKGATVSQGDFASITPRSGDFVYFDPPYHKEKTWSFTSYTGEGFSEGDQERLRDFAISLAEKGVFVMISNSDTELVRRLYSGPRFKIERIGAKRLISRQSGGRGEVGEVVVRRVV